MREDDWGFELLLLMEPEGTESEQNGSLAICETSLLPDPLPAAILTEAQKWLWYVAPYLAHCRKLIRLAQSGFQRCPMPAYG